MRIAILNKYNLPVGFIDNRLPDALHYENEELVNYLQGSANTFKFTCDASHEDAACLETGNKLAFEYLDRTYYLNIETVDENEKTISVVAYSATLELLNEEKDSYTASSNMTFKQYLDVFDSEHTLTLGLNEVSSKSIKLEWTGRETILKRLFSLANFFDAEIELVPILDRDFSLKEMRLNVYKAHSDKYQGVGSDRTDEVLRYGRNIKGVTRTSDITELYTAICPVGSNGTSISSLAKEELDSDGNVLFYTKSGSKYIYAPQSRDMFPSNLMNAESNRYIVKYFDYQTTNVNTLYGQALAELKAHCLPKVTYTIDGYVEANVGDTFMICDSEFKRGDRNEPLYLSARVTSQTICFSDPSKNKTTFDNVVEYESMIDESLKQKVDELQQEIELLRNCIVELTIMALGD